jgi:DNA-binding SARP family transcriptional activator/tetratricopeptide (TPR) repeat protein
MLRVSLLGEQSITDEGTGVRARSSRAIALIGFLATRAGSPQARQRIAGLFWPESADAQALTNLRRELHQLRQILGDEPSLVVTSRDLCWCDSGTCRVDVRTFDLERGTALEAAAAGDDDGVLAHGARALAQYGGDLLPGLYEDWVLEARSELERQCVDLCDLVCAARARHGDLTGAVDAARRRIAMQPLEEVGYRTLMQLLADLGDRAGAVSTYHHCASVLERELAITPDRATRQAFERLMARPGSAPEGIRPPPAGPPPGRSGIASARLVGRSRELGVLQDLWRGAMAGQPGLVVVRGGAGVGKTRLVTETARQARAQGAVVAGSQCFGTAGRLALAPVADWLRNPVIQAATATLDEAWRAEVDRLVPTRGRSGPGAAGPVAAGAVADAWQRLRFFEGLARALLAVDRPILLILDNMQWCDQETLAFLTFCLSLAGGAQFLVASTVRDDPGADPVPADWTDRMRATGLLTELTLTPFEAVDTARLAEAIAGGPLAESDALLLQATTGGFPLYVVEAVRGTADRGQDSRPAGDLTAVLRIRLEQATAAAREVAGLAAAVGRDFTLDLLTEASDLDADVVVGAVDELWRRRIMHELRDGYDFSHDLLRDTAYAQVSPPKRWLLHRRIAQALELRHTGSPDLVAAQLAEQYARGGRPDRAVAYYRRAADVAAARFAHAEAVRLDKEALSIVRDLPPGKDRDSQELAVLEGLAAPLNARYGYSSRELQQTLERSIELAGSLGRTSSRVSGMVALWGTQFVQGRTAEGYRTASRALELADPGSELSGVAHFGVGGSSISLGMPAEGLRHLEIAAELASDAVSLSIGTRPRVHGTAWSAHAHWLLGDDDAARSASRNAIELARSIDHPYNLAVALAYAGITYQMSHGVCGARETAGAGEGPRLRDAPELRRTVAELRELCERYGFAYYREWVLILDGWSRMDGSGLALARQGIDHLRAQGSFARMPYWLSLLADLSERAGQPGAARAILDAALTDANARDDLWWLPEVMRMRAAHDDPDAAVARLRSAARLAAAHGSAALLRRCERDLAARGAIPPAGGVLPTA